MFKTTYFIYSLCFDLFFGTLSFAVGLVSIIILSGLCMRPGWCDAGTIALIVATLFALSIATYLFGLRLPQSLGVYRFVYTVGAGGFVTLILAFAFRSDVARWILFLGAPRSPDYQALHMIVENPMLDNASKVMLLELVGDSIAVKGKGQEPYMDAALRLVEDPRIEGDPWRAQAWAFKAKIALSEHKLVDAETYANRALKVFQETNRTAQNLKIVGNFFVPTYGTVPIDVPIAYRILGQVYDSQKEYGKASCAYGKAAEIYEKRLPPSKLYSGDTYRLEQTLEEQLASSLQVSRESGETESLYQRVIAIQDRWGENHPRYGLSLIAFSRDSNLFMSEAAVELSIRRKLYRLANRGCAELLGQDHDWDKSFVDHVLLLSKLRIAEGRHEQAESLLKSLLSLLYIRLKGYNSDLRNPDFVPVATSHGGDWKDSWDGRISIGAYFHATNTYYFETLKALSRFAALCDPKRQRTLVASAMAESRRFQSLIQLDHLSAAERKQFHECENELASLDTVLNHK